MCNLVRELNAYHLKLLTIILQSTEDTRDGRLIQGAVNLVEEV